MDKTKTITAPSFFKNDFYETARELLAHNKGINNILKQNMIDD